MTVITSEDLKAIKTWSLDQIALALFVEIPHRKNKFDDFIDEHGTFLGSVEELHKLKPYKRFASEIRDWASLSLVYGTPARIDKSVKPYLQAFLRYYKRNKTDEGAEE